VTLTEIRSALTELGTNPRQALGQNFLHDQNLARWISTKAAEAGNPMIVEIGPGLGSLTEFLAGAAERLEVIERDRLLAEWLGRRLGPEVIVHHADAMDFDLTQLWGNGRCTVVGNLPYYISTPLIDKYTNPISPASELVLTLQLEVAARIAATPASPDYGAMSVCVQRGWRVSLLKKLPPSVFYPAPKVSSATVRLQRRPAAEAPPLDEAAFELLVRRGFSERRKQLANLLPGFSEIAAPLGLKPHARAENLSLAEWESLAATLQKTPAQRGEELFDVVDEQDRVIGPQPRSFVHVNNLRHRAIHIMLQNSEGRIFLQRRSRWKDMNPDLWDSSAAGHVDAGEDYLDAAHRELREELGVDCALERVGRLPACEATKWEFVEIFTGRHEGPFQLAGAEIAGGAFFCRRHVERWMRAHPEDFTPLSRMIFPHHVFK
jgi:16S rRNA (adenine1518-N6/adenine1519-N6)-dimethyltransferase